MNEVLKKVLKIAGSVYLGFSFGCLSLFMPHFSVPNLVLLPDPQLLSVWAWESIANGLIAALVMYVYRYLKKREHEDGNLFFQVGGWTFVVGAILVGVALFVYSAGDPYRL